MYIHCTLHISLSSILYRQNYVDMYIVLYSLPDINKAVQYSIEMVRYSIEDVGMGLENICITTAEK